MQVTIPNNFTPRDYQIPLFKYHDNGGRMSCVAWHRRAGKDVTYLALASKWIFEKPGTYWHLFPEYSQARKAIWKAVDPHTGERLIDRAFPHAIREGKANDTEMFIRFKNGSTWQVVGSDNFDSLVGSSPVGVVFSEWALANPLAWAYISPIILENGGKVAFISTFRGTNHHYRMTREAIDSPDWYGEILSAKDTGVFSDEDLEIERKAYINTYGDVEGEAMFRQEYLCDPSAAIQGAFYGAAMMRAEDEGRICDVAYDSGYPVFTGWDIGSNDQTFIWFAQQIGDRVNIIDVEFGRSKGASEYVGILREKPYSYGMHFLPHDGANSNAQTGHSYQEEMARLGIHNTHVIPRAKDTQAVLMDINTARRVIGLSRFDKEKTAYGLDSLKNYRREWDDRLKTYRSKPHHDWASDGADAFRTLAVAWQGDLMVAAPKLDFKMPMLGVA